MTNGATVIDLGRLAFDLESLAFEWEHVLLTAMQRLVGAQGSTTSGIAEPEGIEITMTGGDLDHCRLRVTHVGPNAIECAAVCDRDDQRLVDAWRVAIDEAMLSLPTEDVNLRWTAAIGWPEGQGIAYYAVANRTSVGGMELNPGEVVDAQGIPRARWSVVRGADSGLGYPITWRKVHERLRMLSVLLSIVWKVALVVRVQPNEDLPTELVEMDEAIWGEALPPWAEDAWHLMMSDSMIRQAALVYHEGQLLRTHEHPSFALLAFVASLEGLGLRWKPLDEPCRECGFKMGARRAFRASVEQVVEDSATRKTLMAQYDALRNATVHEGVLHGGEFHDSRGDFTSMLNLSSAKRFVWYDLSLFQRVSEAVLRGLLSGLIT